MPYRDLKSYQQAKIIYDFTVEFCNHYIDGFDKSHRSDQSYKSYRSYRSYLFDPETAANCAICLINQVNFLFDRQIRSLEEKFIKQDGYTENLKRKKEEEKK